MEREDLTNDLCSRCGERPNESGSDLCIECQKEFDEELMYDTEELQAEMDPNNDTPRPEDLDEI